MDDEATADFLALDSDEELRVVNETFLCPRLKRDLDDEEDADVDFFISENFLKLSQTTSS